jgi:hypothetical protein
LLGGHVRHLTVREQARDLVLADRQQSMGS